MQAKVSNINIQALISELTSIMDGSKYCDIIVDEDENNMRIYGIIVVDKKLEDKTHLDELSSDNIEKLFD